MDDRSQFAYDVFISYSHADKGWVRGELLPRLEASGLRVCLDYRDFRPGAPIVKEMERAVLTSRRTLLVLTPNYLASAWTDFETLMLQTLDPANLNFRLMSLLKAKCDVPPRLSYLGYVDFVDEPEIAWDRLLAALAAPVPSSASALPTPTPPAASATLDLPALRKKLIDRCSEGDLRDMCFVMGIDDDNYPAAKSDFVRELLQDLSRRDRLAELVEALRREKPWVLS